MKVIENGTVTNPKGYQGAGLHIGIKKRNKDFALIVSDVEAKDTELAITPNFDTTNPINFP